MTKFLSLIIGITIVSITSLFAIEYQELYDNGQVAELRTEIFSQPYFDATELPRAAFYESLVTSKNFDQTLQELIEGFPDIEYKDQVNFKLGVINFFQRKYSQAEFYFAKIENTNNFNEYNYWVSRLYYMKQEHKQSSKYADLFLANCSKIDHKYELSYYMLIENSISAKNFPKAVVLAEELLKKKPEGINKAFLYYKSAYCYERLDNLDLALINYKKSFQENPYGQYAAMTEERLFELKKSSAKNIDLSFLYTKDYKTNNREKLATYKTNPKQFNLNELVRTDTTSVLSKFFNNQYDKEENNDTEINYPGNSQSNSVTNNPETIVVADNKQNEQEINLTSIETESIIPATEENRVIDNTPTNHTNQDNNGVLLERPTNIQTEGFVYLMEKPVGRYFIQLGRFSRKEFAISRTKELFYLQQTWNIFRDVRGENITYVIWSQPYETAAEAKKDIAKFKSNNIDCFLVSNE